MRLDTYAKIVATQYLSDNELAVIRQFTTKMLETERDHPFGIYSMRMLNHINLITADNAMVDVLAIQNENADLKLQLKAMGQGYFKLAMEKDELEIKLEELGVTV
jgi:hypothetical protein